MKALRIPLLILFVFCIQFSLNAQNDKTKCDWESSVEELSIKAAYLDRFENNVGFKEIESKKEFKVGFLMADEQKTYYDKTLANKPFIKSENFNELNELANYHMVFIGCGFEYTNEQLEQALDKKRILIVTESKANPNLMINLVKKSDKIEYEMNKKSMNEYGFKPQATLVEHAMN